MTATANATRFESIKCLIAFTVKKKLGNRFTEDAVQDAFLYVWERLDSYNPEKATLSTWTCWTTRGAISEYIRREHTYRVPTVHADKLEVVDRSGEPDARETLKARIAEAVQDLEPDYRTVITRRMNGASFSEIARTDPKFSREWWKQIHDRAVRELRSLIS